MKSEKNHRYMHKYPAWVAGIFDNRIRSLIHDSNVLFGDYVSNGDTVVDIGIGGGIFTIGLANLVGESGMVISVDFQQELIDKVRRRAERGGIAKRIRFHKCERDDIGLEISADFVLSFWMVHEVPSVERLFNQVHSLLKPTGKYFIAEPKAHVRKSRFYNELSLAQEAGFRIVAKPKVVFSRAVLLEKSE